MAGRDWNSDMEVGKVFQEGASMQKILQDTEERAAMKGIRVCHGDLVTKSCLTLLTPWTVARQAPLSMGFPRQEYCNGLPFPSPGDLPNPDIEPMSPALQGESLPLSHQGSSISWALPYIFIFLKGRHQATLAPGICIPFLFT